MRRVGRIMFGGAAALSAVVAVLVAVAWGVGAWRAVYVTAMTPRTSTAVGVCRGCVEVEVGRSNVSAWDRGWGVQTLPAREAAGARAWHGDASDVAWRCGRAEWARCDVRLPEDNALITTRSLILPYWPLLAAAIVLPGAWAWRWTIGRRRQGGQGGRGFAVEGLRGED